MAGKAAAAERPKPANGIEVSSTAYGEAIAVIYGRCKVPMRLLWMGKLHHLRAASIRFLRPGAGFGAAQPTTQNFFYFLSMQWAIGEGPIEGVRTLYKRDTFFIAEDFDQPVDGVVQPPNFSGRIFVGTADQPAWTAVNELRDETNKLLWVSPAPDPVIAYPHLANIARHDWPLYQQAQLPNMSVEAFAIVMSDAVRDWTLDTGTAADASGEYPRIVHAVGEAGALKVGANPADALADMMGNPVHGLEFPAGVAVDDYRLACVAHGLLIGLNCGEQKKAREWLAALLEQTNATCRFSNRTLEILPLWDSVTTGPRWAAPADQVTHTPGFLTPTPQGEYAILVRYALTDDDFVGGDIAIERPDPADAFNVHTVEILDRHNHYQPVPVESKDQAAIDTYGRREAPVFEAHALTDTDAGQEIGAVRVQNDVAVRPVYKFTLDWRYQRLDPGDLVSLTQARRQLREQVVRILSLQEDDAKETLAVEAVHVELGLNTVVQHQRQGSMALVDPDYNADPGKIAAPVLFEPTAELAGGRLELWLAVTGQSEQWGGCTVWLSEDGGIDYQPVGQIVQRARMGTLQAALTSGSAEVDVQLTAPAGEVVELEAFSTAEVLRGTSLCLVDGSTSLQQPYELFSYGLPELTAPNRYTLSALSRGRAGTTAQSHRTGANVVRLDDAILRLALPPRLLDPSAFIPLAFKFTSFNRFGGAEQSLEDVPPVAYRAVGTLFRTPVGAITNLAAQFVSTAHGGQLTLTWDAVQDLRGDIEYEVRRGGDHWARAAVLGTTREARFPVVADAVYYVAARVSITDFGTPRYLYGTPASLLIKGTADLVDNVVQSYDELPSQWGSYADAVRADAPALWWRQGSFPNLPSLYDEVSGDAVGTLVGTLVPSAVRVAGGIVHDSGFDNVGLHLAFANQYISLAADARHDLTGDAWSLFFQVQPLTGASQRFLYSKGASGAWLTIEATGRLRWQSASGGTQLDGGTTLYDGQFHQVLLTFERFDAAGVEVRRLRLFLDGSQEAMVDGATFPVATGTTYLGNQGSPEAGAGFGTFDEFAKFDVALEPAVAKSLRFSALYYPAGTFTRNVLARSPAVYLKFGEAFELRAPDFSGQGRTQEHSAVVPALVSGLISGDTDQARSYLGESIYSRSVADLDATFDAGMALELTFQPLVLDTRYLVGFHQLSATALTDGPWVELESTGGIVVHLVDTSGVDHPVQLFFLYEEDVTYHLVATYTKATGRFAAWINGALVADTIVGSFDLRISGRRLWVCHSPDAVTRPSALAVVDEVVLFPALADARAHVHATAATSGATIDGLEVMPDTGYLRAKPLSTGTFRVPGAHIVTLARRMLVRVTAGWDAVAVGPGTIAHVANVNALGQVNPLDLAHLIAVQPEISLSDDPVGEDWTGGGTRPEWAPFQPGNYLARRIRLRVRLSSLAAGITAELRQFRWAVDVPDLVQSGTVTTSATGVVTVTYARPYHGGTGGAAAPSPVVSLRSAGAGTGPEFIRVTNETTTGFDVEVLTTGGARLIRDLTWFAQGY